MTAAAFKNNPLVKNTLSKAVIQPKLMVNAPGDRYEQEADAMADRVMRMGNKVGGEATTGMIGKSVQRKCSHCEEEEKKKKGGTIMRKMGNGYKKSFSKNPLSSKSNPIIQRKCTHFDQKEKKKSIMRKEESGGGFEASSGLTAQLNSTGGTGFPLPEATRNFMEQAFSTDFSQVRIHTDSTAVAMNREVNANAFTYGSDIYFRSGKFETESLNGKKLLAHELTHVMQQSANKSTRINRDTLQSEVPPNPWGQNAKIPNGLSQFPQPSKLPSNFPIYADEEPDVLKFTSRRFWNEDSSRGGRCKMGSCHGNNLAKSSKDLDRLVTEPRLIQWAIDEGTKQVEQQIWLRFIQTETKSNIEIALEVFSNLSKSISSSHEFEGSNQARKTAVGWLTLNQEHIVSTLHDRLREWVQNQFVIAFKNTPEGANLVTDPSTILNLINKPNYGQVPTGRWNDMAFRGKRYNNLIVVSASDGPLGSVFFKLIENPWWFYQMGINTWILKDMFIGEVYRQISERASFAAEIFPLFIKIVGFGLGFSTKLGYVLAGIVMEEYAEEAKREVRGQPQRSVREIFTSAGLALLVDRVINKATSGGAANAKSLVSKNGLKLISKVESKAESKITQEIMDGLIEHEGPKVIRALENGAPRRVSDPNLLDKGYTMELEIFELGEKIIYRQQINGRWCRFFNPTICDISLGGEVASAAQKISKHAEIAVKNPKLFKSYIEIANRKLPEIIVDLMSKYAKRANQKKLAKLRKEFVGVMENAKDFPNLPPAYRYYFEQTLSEARRLARKEFDFFRKKIWQELRKDKNFRDLEKELFEKSDAIIKRENKGSALSIRSMDFFGEIVYKELNIEHLTRLSDNPWKHMDKSNLSLADAKANQFLYEEIRKTGGVWPTDPIEEFIIRHKLNKEGGTESFDFAPGAN